MFCEGEVIDPWIPFFKTKLIPYRAYIMYLLFWQSQREFPEFPLSTLFQQELQFGEIEKKKKKRERKREEEEEDILNLS